MAPLNSIDNEIHPRKLATIQPGDEIVISGIAGRFPESDNVNELRDNLMKKIDMITSDARRWKLDDPYIPQRTGKINNISKFDASFFGVHYKQAHTMDPVCRMLLEHAFEAILDAGINPKQLYASRTGVFVGAGLCESEKTWLYEKSQVNGFGITGCARSMLANRISYYLGITGPSYTVDSACSSSLYAVEQAYRAINEDLCDAAIVATGNLCLHPYVSKQFCKLGVLSSDGRCKIFDESADGYVRSEAICVVFLQKAKDARRCYATLVHAKINCDGFKEEGVTFPSTRMQSRLLEEFYLECGIPTSKVSYIEAHGTGTKVGDPEEVNAIDRVFSKNRTNPLLIGSVKSNLGHTEPASGLVSIAKVIIAMETGVIPPNINFKQCKKELTAILEGRMKIVTDCTPWQTNYNYAAVNSFGFGGANAHILLKSNDKLKVNNGIPRDDLPRLVVVSGRTEEAVFKILNDLESKPVDVEYIALLHNIHSEEINDHLYRGYTLLPSHGITKSPIKEIMAFSGIKRPICFVFSGMGSQWPGMGEALLRIPIFAKAINKCDVVLKPLGIDIIKVITSKDKATFDNIVHCFIGIAAIQIGLVDVLFSLGIRPDIIIGHSFGELACAYADGCFTAEQTILSAYSRGITSIQTETIYGSMAAVGLGYEDLKNFCPNDIEVACHNSFESATISGPAESMKQFVAELTARNIFAKEVSCANIPYHSRYIAAAGPKLLAYLNKIIPEPKLRSNKWLSTSVSMDKWDTDSARYSSAEYHTNNLLNPVLFQEATELIPKNAITIEIAPHGLLQAILRRSLDSSITNISLTRRAYNDNVEMLCKAIGKLFNLGLHPQLSNLYPPVEFPVSRSTPMISPLIKWQHTDDWYVTSYSDQQRIKSSERVVKIAISDSEYESLAGHVIDGRNLLPATGYLALIWETLGLMRGEMYTELSVVFEDVRFLRATNLPKDGEVELTLMIQKGTGRFEITEGEAALVTGFVRLTSQASEEKSNPLSLSNDLEEEEEEWMTSRDVYKELRLRGYQYTGNFRGITRASINGSRGYIHWQNDWIAFIDNMLQIKALAVDTRGLFVPTAIEKLVIDSHAHHSQIKFGQTDKEFQVLYDKLHDVIVCGGVEILGLKVSAIPRKKLADEPIIEEYKFIANTDGAQMNIGDIARIATSIAMENHVGTKKVKTIEIVDEADKLSCDNLLTPWFSKSFNDLPLVQADMTILTTRMDLIEETSLKNFTVINPNKTSRANNAILVGGCKLLTNERTDQLKLLLDELIPGGFLLTREDDDIENVEEIARLKDFHVVLVKKYAKENFILLRKREKLQEQTVTIEINNETFDWLDSARKSLQAYELEKGTKSRIVMVGQGDFDNGLMGLIKCLKQEPGGEAIRAVLIQDPKAPAFSLKDPLYAKQLQKDLSINVLRENGIWGTYRHLPLPSAKPKRVQHKYVKQLVRGDLSSLTWIEGPNNFKDNAIRIIYASINFKDVMLATGKLALETVAQTRQAQDCVLGFEYSGIDNSGKRVMGLLENRGMSNFCIPDEIFTWQVPDNWSLEDAATVPCVYGTCIYALYVKANLKKGHRVLIHSGTGGIGQAAINLALAEGCEVFTTVGTPEKRRFIRDHFPEIDDDHIGNSRDVKFVNMIKKVTRGRGVDIVLNSLSEDKLRASVDCLAEGGQFLEIGKFDLEANNPLGMKCFLKQVSFHGIMFDRLMAVGSVETLVNIKELMYKLLKNGTIKPFVRTVFDEDQVEKAFRYMATGKHIGKVLLKLKDEENGTLALPHYYCLNDRSYIILGGLGGFGLELADWLVLRGAKNLVITSRNGLKNGYQRMRLELWRSYGVQVVLVSGKDASYRHDCQFILETAGKLAPVDGIFNLAVVLKDALFENQTPGSFEESFKPKARATKNLDLMSRKLCPQLRHFVVFSSVSCGKGNVGQTNYGMANSIMERICERRVSEGLPGLAIQWGAIGDVGLVADMQQDNEKLVMGGTLPQRISSCLQQLDNFLRQKQPVVSSMVIADNEKAGKVGALNIVQTVQNIMGLKDLKVIGPNVSLVGLGMDSMMSVEVKQTLEREFGVFLSTQDIRRLTFAKLQEMADELSEDNATKRTDKCVTDVDADVTTGMRILVRLIGKVDLQTMKHQKYLRLAISEDKQKNEIFMIPGIEGLASVFDGLASKIKAAATCLQLGIADSTFDSVFNIADNFMPHVLEKCRRQGNFKIVGYSFGSLIAIELARKLEAEGLNGKLILIDGAPEQMKAIVGQERIDDDLQNKTLLMMLDALAPNDHQKLAEKLKKCNDWQNKVQAFDEICPLVNFGFPSGSHQVICSAMYNRLIAIINYDVLQLKPIKASITLMKPLIRTINMDLEDYGLSKITKGQIKILYASGNHLTMLDDDKLVLTINEDILME